MYKKKNLIKTTVIFIVILFATIVYTNYRKTIAQEKTKPLIVVTTNIIGDFVKQVVGNKMEVITLMPPGVDPHSYEATMQDGICLLEADLIFFNGLHLEGAMQNVLKSESYKREIYSLSDCLDDKELLFDKNFPIGKDPHIWFDVKLVKKMIIFITEKVQEYDFKNSDYYKEQSEVFLENLEELHIKIQKGINSIPKERCFLITSHDAFEYFGSAYGLQVKGLQGISTQSAIGIGDRDSLKNFIIEHQIPTIYTESSTNSKPLDAVAESCRVEGYNVAIHRFLYSDSLGSGKEGTYIGMMEANLSYIVKGLSASEQNTITNTKNE